MTRRWAAWGGPLLLAGALLALLAWGWGSWGDVQVDSGREWYTPWRLLEGEVLYRDLAWFNGPLSPYVNALWYAALGVSVRSQLVGNLLVLGVVLAVCWRLLRDLGGELAATAGGLALLLLCAGGGYLQYGTFNFLAPYSHELTHGVALSLGALLALRRYQRRGQGGDAALVGGLLGLAALTKPEVLLALAPALAAGWGALAWLAPARRPALARHGLLALGCALLPALLAWVALAGPLGAGPAARAVLGGWVYLGDPALRGLPYYRALQGLDAPGRWASELLARLLVEGALLAPVAWLDLRLAGASAEQGRAGALAVGLGLLGVGLAGTWGWGLYEWELATTPLPALMAAVVLALALELRRARPLLDPASTRLVPALCFALLALGLLAKLGLRARLSHYGFALALPATLTLVLVGVAWGPEVLRRRGGSGRALQAGALAVLAVVVVGHRRLAQERLGQLGWAVGQGADALRCDERGVVLAPLLEELAARVGPRETLLVLPEGVGLNFLLRRRTPTPYFNLMPPELVMFGEGRILAACEAAPPDWVVLLSKDTTNYGVRTFGRDYGRAILAWVARGYQPLLQIGADPLQPEGFGALILRRR